MKMQYPSWGQANGDKQFPFLFDRRLLVDQVFGIKKGSLPYGNGRSYGDSCLSVSNQPIVMKQRNYFISLDSDTGVLHCEAGVLLKDILDLTIPHGWFLPVTPGTQFVSVAGAVANDVHGKNHHQSGTFGCHLLSFGLLRSDGYLMQCSREQNQALYDATIGGLGLTGIITDIRLQLKKIKNPNVIVERVKFSSIEEYFQLTENSNKDFEYTVSWIDCLAKGPSLGRGLFMRGNHQNTLVPSAIMPSKSMLSCPFTPPISLINQLSLKAFNTLYYNQQRVERVYFTQGYQSFFYPLDGISNWNRIYGNAGFQQLQFVVPKANAKYLIKDVLRDISKQGIGSFLAVLKDFGDKSSPGLLSFPTEGTTLALDFPNSKATDALIQRVHNQVAEANGRVYPAKDAVMTAYNFKRFYPNWESLEALRDVNLCSKFWHRTALGNI